MFLMGPLAPTNEGVHRPRSPLCGRREGGSRVMRNPPPEHPLRRLFAGLAEHAFFSHLGVADPPLTDYLSTLLTRFLHFDAVYRLRNEAGKPITELTEMVIEAEQLPAGGRTRREYYRHIGDFALFWTGLYPEAVERLRGRA